MLKTETIQKIAVLTKLKAEDITAAIADAAEVDLIIDEKLSTLTEAEKGILEKNKYEEGKKAGVEISVDDVKKELKLDFQGKTLKGLVEAANKKALEDAKIEPAEKVKELQKDIETLRSENTRITGEKDTAIGEATRIKTDVKLYAEVPESLLSASDLVALARIKGYDFKEENGKLIPYKNGEPVKDHLAQPRAIKDVLTEFTKEAKLEKVDTTIGGRGGSGGVGGGGTYSKYSEVEAAYKAKGKSTLGEEFKQEVAKLAKENKDFKMGE